MASSEEGKGVEGVGRERITFVPHPRTITAAGDLEYFTSTRGKQTVSYALAELVDNALSATQHLATAGERKVRIVFCVNSSSSASVFVEDNGVGMSTKELNDWAVMNLSKSEREQVGSRRQSGSNNGSGSDPSEFWAGSQPPQQQTQKQKQAGWKQDRFLFSSLSFFGVGSKNAAFFLGNSVHIATKQDESAVVHDLHLSATELEEKYRKNENAYEADLVHRSPGDASTLSAEEKRFGPILQAVDGEKTRSKASFTRLTVSELKGDIVKQIKDKYSCEQICRELAHIYHFYVHGATRSPVVGGEQEGPAECKLPDGSALPEIQVETHIEGRLLFKTTLAEIEDDSLSVHLKSQRAEFLFSLEVPQRGCVDGILYYFPFDSEKETMPSLAPGSGSPSPQATQATQFDLTQVSMTQFGFATQGQAGMGLDQGVAQAPRRCLFETFWQGRLIPESRVVSLPFIDSIFQKQTTKTRDKIPPEVANRIWGCLFFGPEFRVTRNKLSFRDNLEDLLCSSFSSNRNTEKKFKEWLARCHADLDQTLSFEALCPTEVQAAMRHKFGENRTFFDKVVMGETTLVTGDVVQLKTTPKVVGRVVTILATKVMHAEGRHSNGLLAIEPIPEEIFGKALALYPLRRFRAKLSAEEAEAHVKKQWRQAPATISIEPMMLATGETHTFAAGDKFPPTYAAVANASGHKVTRGISYGKKQNLSVIQKLYYLGPDLPQETPDLTLAVRESVSPAGSGASPVEVLCVSNCTPRNDVFGFQKVNGGLTKAGHYLMKYTVEPNTSKSPLVLEMRCLVSPGPARRMELEAEAKIEVAHLGETLPSLTLALFDDFDNLVEMGPYMDKVTLAVDTGTEEIAISALSWTDKVNGRVVLKDIRLAPSDNGAIPYFCARGRSRKQSRPSPLKCKLIVKVEGYIEETLKIVVLPGLPASFDVVSGLDLEANSEASPLQLAQDGPFPSFEIALKDQYGNRACPPKDMTYTMRLTCDGLVPNSRVFAAEASGFVRIEGFTAGSSATTSAELELKCSPADSILETCTMNDNVIAKRDIWIQVEPSTRPAHLVILRDGSEVQKDPNGSDDFVIEDIQVATFLEDLCLEVRDAGGRPAACGKSAKLTCSWLKGTKLVPVDAQSRITLPSLAVQDNCGSVVSFWIRMVLDGLHLEASVFVKATPGPPYSWAISCESNKVHCGVPFVVIIEAVDKYQNRCMCGSSQLPTPIIDPQSEREIRFSRDEWDMEWICDEDNMYTYSAKMVLIGEQGSISLRVHSDEDLKMTEDIWHAPLLPGPPAKLSLSIPNENQKFYTQCFVESIVCSVQDVYGNDVGAYSDFEVLLHPVAKGCGAEGVSGKISAQKGNRKKVENGKVEFKSLKLSCPQVGKYVLQAMSKSRKVSIEEAALEIEVRSCNRILGLTTALQEVRCQAGGAIDIDVIVETENGDPVPEEVLPSFQIIIANERAAAPTSVSAKFVDFDAKAMRVQFASDKITCAGAYSVTAAYVESRQALGTYQVRSLSQRFEVVPFEPKQVSLLPLEADAKCTILRLSDKTLHQRPVMPEGSAMQLQDIYGNAVAKQGVKLTMHLYEDEALEREVKKALTCDKGQGQVSISTDKGGKALLGKIGVSDECKAMLMQDTDENATSRDFHFVVRCHQKKANFVGWRRVLCYSNDERQAEERERKERERKSLEKSLSSQKERLKGLEDALVAQKEDLGFGGKSLRSLDNVLREERAKLSEAEKKKRREPQVKGVAKFATSLILAKKVASSLCLGFMVDHCSAEHETLAKVLSWYRRNKLQVLVMATMEAMKKARKALKQKNLDIPDMIAEEAMRVFDPSRRRKQVGCKVTSAEAALLGQLGVLPKKLHEDAITGSDAALALPLPHHLIDKHKWPKGLESWPKGFVGHAVNLVRPVLEDKRKTILYCIMGTALVFDEWANAYAYFKACRKDLRVDVSTCLNLDGTSVESDGVLSGSRNTCPEKMDSLRIAFGSAETPTAAQRERVAGLDQVVRLNQERMNLITKMKHTKRTLRDLDPNLPVSREEEEEVPSSEKKRSLEPQESHAVRTTRRRRLVIQEMDD